MPEYRRQKLQFKMECLLKTSMKRRCLRGEKKEMEKKIKCWISGRRAFLEVEACLACRQTARRSQGAENTVGGGGQVMGSLGWKGERLGYWKPFPVWKRGRHKPVLSSSYFHLMSPSVATALRIDSGGTWRGGARHGQGNKASSYYSKCRWPMRVT